MGKLEKVRKISKDYMEELEDPAHNWHHVQRVYNLCERIGGEEDADMKTLRIGALLHDIGLTENREKHGEIGADMAEEILEDLGFKIQLIQHVKDMIKSHRFSNNHEPKTLEAWILRDADRLDAMGAVGIARIMAYNGLHNREIHDPERGISDVYGGFSETAIIHFHEKILKLKDGLKTSTARKIGRKRHEYMEKYVERFLDEWEGKK